MKQQQQNINNKNKKKIIIIILYEVGKGGGVSLFSGFVSITPIGLPPPRQIRFSLRFLKPSKSLDPSSRSHRQSNKNGKDEEN